MAEELVRKLQNWSAWKENLPDFKDLLKSKSIRSDIVEVERRGFLEAIQNYVGDDPLKPWVRCIKWARTYFSSGIKSELAPLLELCTQKFVDDPRYRDDLRYLRIWIRYADCCSEPLHVFEFLEKKRIGQSHSLFYEAYAVILELRGDLVKADEVYQLGISRQAQPVEQLQTMYKSFLKRKATLRTSRADGQTNGNLNVRSISNAPSNMTCTNKTSKGELQTEKDASGKHTFEEFAKAPHQLTLQTGPGRFMPDEYTAVQKSLSETARNGWHQEALVTSANKTRQSYGDETIAIKKYAEDAIVLGVDPEVDTESHLGLVDPTINTKEAMVNVLSLFNQPLPLEQVRKSRATRTDHKPEKSSGMDFEIYVDDDFSADKNGNQKGTEQSLHVFVDECFGSRSTSLKAEATTIYNARDENSSKHSNVQSAVEQNFEVFVDECLGSKTSRQQAENLKRLDPWDETLIAKLLKDLNPPLSTYKGFHASSKKYNGSIPLSSLKNNARNKTLDLGSSTYYLRGCTGQGAYAQVYQAHDKHDKTVVLKIQKPPCPWEFYIYRQLDKRVPSEERKSFAHACKMHVYSDCSIMVADYGQHGTLQDVVNAYLAHGQKMDELLCMYYTIEMLRMLEILHAAGIIHGDFKPDNLLIRNDSENWEDWSPNRPGCWKDQGLCLIDWGRSIDMHLFPTGTEFIGDSRTSGFRCIEMIEGRPWTYQVDNFGLCGIVHCMLHGNYMEIQEEKGRIYKPKSQLKRYWNTSLWDKLFSTLLNVPNCDSNPPLGCLRAMLEEFLSSSPSYSRRLKELLMKQSVMMCAKR